MQLSKPQQIRFWREWSAIKSNLRHEGSTDAQIETERHALLQRAGFDSLTHVDPGAGFTAVLKELAILQNDLAGMLHADANQRRQKIFLITHKGRPGYWRRIAQDRFGTLDLDTLADAQLDQLLYTVSDRQVGQHRYATQRRRHFSNQARREAAQENPESRIQFPDLASVPSQPTPAAPVAAPARELDPENAPF